MMKKYSYNELFTLLNIEANKNNVILLKSIVHSLIHNNLAIMEHQKIYTDIELIKEIWKKHQELKKYFDYEYNTKQELTSITDYLINKNEKKKMKLLAVFCPGYTNNGYKSYVGENNSRKLSILSKLNNDLNSMLEITVLLADVFVENCNNQKNANWKSELTKHREKFINLACSYFDDQKVKKLSEVFPKRIYLGGFIEHSILNGKTYVNFVKNNLPFYLNMGWNYEDAINRINKLYTIYSLMSEYIKEKNGIYLPMENMYFRSKVMTNSNVTSLYLKK